MLDQLGKATMYHTYNRDDEGDKRGAGGTRKWCIQKEGE